MLLSLLQVVNETCRYVDHFLHIHYDHYPARFAVEAMKKLADDEELEVNAMRFIQAEIIIIIIILYNKVDTIKSCQGSCENNTSWRKSLH